MTRPQVVALVAVLAGVVLLPCALAVLGAAAWLFLDVSPRAPAPPGPRPVAAPEERPAGPRPPGD
jgi:hypothetical protein